MNFEEENDGGEKITANLSIGIEGKTKERQQKRNVCQLIQPIWSDQANKKQFQAYQTCICYNTSHYDKGCLLQLRSQS